jgi:hypothetical protein
MFFVMTIIYPVALNQHKWVKFNQRIIYRVLLKGCFKFQNGKKKCLRFHHRFDLRPHQNGDENGVKMKTETPRSGFLSVFMKNIDTKKEIINSLAEGFKLRKVKGTKDN